MKAFLRLSTANERSASLEIRNVISRSPHDKCTVDDSVVRSGAYGCLFGPCRNCDLLLRNLVRLSYRSGRAVHSTAFVALQELAGTARRRSLSRPTYFGRGHGPQSCARLACP